MAGQKDRIYDESIWFGCPDFADVFVGREVRPQLFLRSLARLHHKAAKQAFSARAVGRKPPSTRKEFLDLPVNHLTEQGVVDTARFD